MNELFLYITGELLNIELADVVEVLGHFAFSVVHEDHERLAKEFWCTLRVLQEQVAHDNISGHLVELMSTEVEEAVAHLQAEVRRDADVPALTQRTAEALDDEIVACDLSPSIALPEVDICLPISIVKDVRMAEAALQKRRMTPRAIFVGFPISWGIWM